MSHQHYFYEAETKAFAHSLMIHIERAHDVPLGCHCVYVTFFFESNLVILSMMRVMFQRVRCGRACAEDTRVPVRPAGCLLPAESPTLLMNLTPGVCRPLAASGVARCPLKSEADCL